MSVCVKCGEELREGMKFCINCGTPAESPAAEEKKEKEAAPQIEAAAEEVSAEAAPAAPVIPAAPAAEPEKTEEPCPGALPEEKPAPAAAVVTTPPPPRPPVIEAPKPAPAAEFGPKEDSDKPGKKSKWGIISTWGYIGIDLLMAIPVVGFILTVIWACGGCRKYAKRNYARSKLIFFVAGIVLTVAAALVVRFAFPELIVAVYEAINPGYTIIFP